jgi:hypothetical protein
VCVVAGLFGEQIAAHKNGASFELDDLTARRAIECRLQIASAIYQNNLTRSWSIGERAFHVHAR